MKEVQSAFETREEALRSTTMVITVPSSGVRGSAIDSIEQPPTCVAVVVAPV